MNLHVYDVNGRLIRTLIDKDLEAGPHDIEWRGENDHGQRSEPGVYFYRLVTPGFARTRKTLLVP